MFVISQARPQNAELGVSVIRLTRSARVESRSAGIPLKAPTPFVRLFKSVWMLPVSV